MFCHRLCSRLLLLVALLALFTVVYLINKHLINDNLSLHAVTGGVMFMSVSMLVGDTCMLVNEYLLEREREEQAEQMGFGPILPRIMVTRV